MTALAEHEPEPLAPRPVVMADDPCEAASSSADPFWAGKYYRARYYDPKIGRFISEDPIGFEADVNFYAYVENNPVNVTDPWGLIGEAGGGRKPKPPAPTPTPRSSPGPTISHRPRHTLQGVLNLCPAPSELIFWDFFPSNPHYAQFQGPFKVWRDAFVDACNAAQLPGTYTSSYFGIANPTPAGFTIGMYQFGSPVGIGCCCREKCSK